MNINTKYEIGQKVFYFDNIQMKLTEVTIVSVNVSMDASALYANFKPGTVEQNTTYGIDRIGYCEETCSTLDPLEAYFKDVELKNAIVEERFIFNSRQEFVDYVSYDPSTTTFFDDLPYMAMTGPNITIVDGNTKTTSQ